MNVGEVKRRWPYVVAGAVLAASAIVLAVLGYQAALDTAAPIEAKAEDIHWRDHQLLVFKLEGERNRACYGTSHRYLVNGAIEESSSRMLTPWTDPVGAFEQWITLEVPVDLHPQRVVILHEYFCNTGQRIWPNRVVVIDQPVPERPPYRSR